MMELFLVKPKEMIEIPTEQVVWSGRRFGGARKIDATILNRKGVGHPVVNVEEGNTVLFKWKGRELFRGTVFRRSRSNNGKMTFTAYDVIQYMILNRDVYVFENVRADQIINRMLNDFQIPRGNVVNTGYSFKSLIFDSETSLYDMALKALVDTQKQTGNKYYIYAKQGKVNVERIVEHSSVWVLETGVNIEEFTFETSIEETATQVKLVAGEEKKQIRVTVTDNAGRSKYGVIQHFEKVTEDINQAQLKERASKILDERKGVHRKFSINALGIPDIISGMPIRVIEKEIPIDRTYYVDNDSHAFKGNSHLMSLDLIEDNAMPKV